MDETIHTSKKIRVCKTHDFQDYISKNHCDDELKDLELFLNDKIVNQDRFTGLDLVEMKLFHDPEDVLEDPEIDLYFIDKSSFDKNKFALDFEEEIKKYIAKRSKDKDDFKRRLLSYRRYRVLFKDIAGR